jgi:branched-chain amino acid transport system permease protein
MAVLSNYSLGSHWRAYALMGIGFSLTWQAMRVINFAHGAMGALGAFIAAWLLIDIGIPYAWAFLLGVLGVGFIGVLIMDWLIYQPLRRRRVSEGMLLVAFIAAAIAVQQSIAVLWPYEGYSFPPIFRAKPIIVSGIIIVPKISLFSSSAMITVLALTLLLCHGKLRERDSGQCWDRKWRV